MGEPVDSTVNAPISEHSPGAISGNAPDNMDRRGSGGGGAISELPRSAYAPMPETRKQTPEIYPRSGEGSGIEWFVGAPESGKTTLALKHAFALVEMRRVPLIVVDNGHITMLENEYHEHNLDELAEGAYREGVSCYYTPKDPNTEVDLICDMAYMAKDCILLMDETNYFLTARSPVKSGFLRLMRSHQHCRVHILCTTQHLSGDIPAACFSCVPHVYIFRCESRPALRYIEDEWNINRETVLNLPQFAYIEHFRGFGLDKATAAR